MQPMLSQSSSSLAPEDNIEYPILVLTQQPDSHHFNERRIILNDTIKVGRSVARARPCESNAIFDCKVLSRNHAIFWFDNGKVWLKDTKSSNGTFVNSQLLSKGTEDSAPREIYSGDIIQFGVEVVENTTTHGCIIAQTTIFLSDGNELRRHSDLGGVPSGNIPISNYYEEQIYQLAQYIQEASHREQTLEKKLNSLSQLIVDTQEASDSSWKVILNQDRLMEKLELLQEQVDMYAKGDDRDSLTSDLRRVLEQRYGLERESKSLLEGLIEEKTDVLQRVVDLEQSLSASEVECSQLRTTLESLQSEHGQITERLTSGKDEVEGLLKKLQDAQTEYANEISRLSVEKDAMRTRYEQLCNEAEHLRGKLEEAENELARGHSSVVDVESRYMGRLRDMMQQSSDRQSDLDLSMAGIHNQLSTALVAEILALQNINNLEDSMEDSDKSIDSFIVGTTSDLGLHFIESHQQIRNGMALIGLMKEELIRLQQIVHNEKMLMVGEEGSNVEVSLQEMDGLLEKMEGSQFRTKTLLAEIPERLLTRAAVEHKRNIEIGLEDKETKIAVLTTISNNSGMQTDRTTVIDSACQFSTALVITGSKETQVDWQATDNLEALQQSLQSLNQERIENGALRMDLLQLQASRLHDHTAVDDLNIQLCRLETENRQLEKKSYDLSLVIEELKLDTVSSKQDMDTRRESVQRIANEGYCQLYQESQELRKRVQEIEEEMTQKRQEYDVLYEQYERLIATQTTVTSTDFESVVKVRELEALCSRQQSEMDEMRDSVSNSYQTILARSRKISAISVVPLCVLLLGIIVSIISFLARPWLTSES